MKILLIISLLFLSVSCTQDPTKPPSPAKVYTAGMIAKGFTQGTITVFGPCENEEKIAPYWDTKVNGWFGLPENKSMQKGILGSACAAAASAIIPYAFGSLTNAVVPKEFGCKGENSGKAMAKLASMACSFIPL